MEVSSARCNDRGYFKEIVRQLERGGYEAMLHELQSRDVKIGPDPFTTIKTGALFEQIIQTAHPIESKRPVNQQLLIQSFDQFHGMSAAIRWIL